MSSSATTRPACSTSMPTSTSPPPPGATAPPPPSTRRVRPPCASRHSLRPKPAKTPASRMPLGKRVDVPATEHGIDPALLDERAVKVVRTLQEAGFEAFIVGGAVRDLLAGRRPKDFDVATNATPEQVK